MGLRAVDGRNRQPGRGAQRPRGFLSESEIPEAAWAGVPVLPAALAAALTMASEATLAKVVAPAVALAKAESKERADVLQRIARRGAMAMTERPVSDELVAAAGKMAGGILTSEDLAEALATIEPCAIEEGERAQKRRIARSPWNAADAEASLHEPRIVAAADGRGRVAIACYEAADAALDVPALGLAIPRTASPVRRGEPRVRPGEPRPSVAPIALLEAEGALQAALGFAGAGAEAPLDAALRAFLAGLPVETAAHEHAAGRVPVGVLRTGLGARAV